MAQHTKSTWAKDSIILGLKLFPQVSFKCNVQHTVKGNWADGERRQHKRESAVTGDKRRQPGSLHWENQQLSHLLTGLHGKEEASRVAR